MAVYVRRRIFAAQLEAASTLRRPSSNRQKRSSLIAATCRNTRLMAVIRKYSTTTRVFPFRLSDSKEVAPLTGPCGGLCSKRTTSLGAHQRRRRSDALIRQPRVALATGRLDSKLRTPLVRLLQRHGSFTNPSGRTVEPLPVQTGEQQRSGVNGPDSFDKWIAITFAAYSLRFVCDSGSPCPTPPSSASRRRSCRRCPSPAPGRGAADPRVRHRRPARLDERRRHPGSALAAYRRGVDVVNAADPQCRVDWALVAAIGKVESNHGRYGGNGLDRDGTVKPGIYGIPLDGRNDTAVIRDSDGGTLDRDATSGPRGGAHAVHPRHVAHRRGRRQRRRRKDPQNLPTPPRRGRLPLLRTGRPVDRAGRPVRGAALQPQRRLCHAGPGHRGRLPRRLHGGPSGRPQRRAAQRRLPYLPSGEPGPCAVRRAGRQHPAPRPKPPPHRPRAGPAGYGERRHGWSAPVGHGWLAPRLPRRAPPPGPCPVVVGGRSRAVGVSLGGVTGAPRSTAPPGPRRAPPTPSPSTTPACAGHGLPDNGDARPATTPSSTARACTKL